MRLKALVTPTLWLDPDSQDFENHWYRNGCAQYAAQWIHIKLTSHVGLRDSLWKSHALQTCLLSGLDTSTRERDRIGNFLYLNICSTLCVISSEPRNT